MKRKLMRLNKLKISVLFRKKKDESTDVSTSSNEVTLASIALVKETGQKFFQKRLAAQRRMTKRQLKKLRKKQMASGLAGSRFSAICQSKLQPASTVPIKKTID